MTDFLGGSTGKFSLMGRTDRTNQLGFISLADGKNNAYIGLYAGASRPQAGTNNTFVGTYAGSNASSDSSVFVGTATGRRATRIKESTFIGYKAGELSERVESSVSIGAYSGRKMIRANCNTLLGYQSGAELTSGSRNTILGAYAAFSQFNAHDNVCIGHRSGYKNTIGSNNCYIGTNSGFAAYQGYDNVALGVKSGEGLTSGKKNVLVGYGAGANISGASNCIAIGTQAMADFYDGDTNTCVGTQAARRFTGINNTILGGYSTSNASGDYNTIVGSRSMNRRSGDRVALSNCVILGENIQFDIPVRLVTAYANDMDIIPESQFGNPDNVNTMILSTPSRTFAALNLVPVGDPMLVKERYISFGSLTDPVTIDTTETGTYTIAWGSAIDEDDQLMLPIPIILTIDVFPTKIAAALQVYGDYLESWDLDVTETLDVFVAQSFNPPSVRVVLGTQVDYTGFPDLPGMVIGVQRVPTYTDDVITLYANSNTHILVPGMEIQINDSAIDALNTIWRIASVQNPLTGGIVPFTIDISGTDIGGSDLGTAITVLSSRTVTRPVVGTVVDGSCAISEPFFAGMLYGNLTPLRVYVDGSGQIPEGVYDVYPTNIIAGKFAIPVALEDDTDVYVGAMTIGTFEPLIIGFEMALSYKISGPTGSDGHVQSGAGSQSQMDANIDEGYLEFVGGGYEYVTYDIPLTNTMDISGTFAIPLADDIDFGFTYLGHYDVKITKEDTGVSMSITSTNDGIITNVLQFATNIQLIGSIEATDFPVNIADLLNTPNPQMTVNIKHDIILQTLTFTIIFQGGTRYGKHFIASGPSHRAKILVGYVPVPVDMIPTVVYYANAPTKLLDIAIDTGNPGYPDSVVNNYSLVYSQRSDTGLQETILEGPTAFDGHTYRGDTWSLQQMDQDIRNNILTFSPNGFSAADYTVGALSTIFKTEVTFAWGSADFGVEWLDAYTLLCKPRETGSFSIEVYHEISQKFLVSFTPEELYGRVTASIVRYSGEEVQIPMTYPLDVADIQPQSVKIKIDHHIKTKILDLTITVFGAEDTVVYTIVLAEAPPIKRLSENLSFVAYGATTAQDILITQTNYKAYPTFEDCIFVGSNFTVGGNIDIIDKERSNVMIAAIGDTRLFRGRTEEFVFFSNVVTANTLRLAGSAEDTATLVIDAGVSGNAVYVDGNVTITGTLDVESATTLQNVTVTGPASFQDTLGVIGAASFQDTLGVTDAATFQDTLSVAGAVTLQSTLGVTDAVSFQDTLHVTDAVTFQDTLGVTGVVTLQDNCLISGDLAVTQTLDVTGDATFRNDVSMKQTLDVDGAVNCNGTLNVDGAVNFNNTLDVAGTLTVGGMTDLNSTLSVAGLASLDGGITTTTVDASGLVSGGTIASDSSVSGLTLDIDNSATIGTISAGATSVDSLSVTNNADVSGTLTVREDITIPISSDAGDVTIQGTAVKASIDGLNSDVDALQTAVDTKVSKSGDTMSGGLTVNSSIYGSSMIITGVVNSGDTNVAVLEDVGGGQVRISRSNQTWALESQIDNKVSKSGDTMSGSLSVTGSISSTTSIFAQNRVVAGDISSTKGGTLISTGTCNVGGNLNVDGTKNFRIPHPLDSSTHLAHACIESPRCDLMYRGSVVLHNGRATVIIDAECTRGSGMTPGTFEALTTNPAVFLQSIDSFDRVRGHVDSGGVLHIASENPESMDRVQWMVLAERNDAYMRQAYPDGIFDPENSSSD